jgi:hypothetical protein
MKTAAREKPGWFELFLPNTRFADLEPRIGVHHLELVMGGKPFSPSSFSRLIPICGCTRLVGMKLKTEPQL